MKTIKPFLSLLVMLLAAVSLSANAWQRTSATRAVSPRQLVVNLYAQHKKRSPFFQTRSRALLDTFFDRTLAGLLWRDAHSAGGEVGALDGDPLFNAQDMEIRNFMIGAGEVGAQAAEVPVSFENFGVKHKITFQLQAERSGWRISNLLYDEGTSLVDILRDDHSRTQAVKVYLVALGDDGKAGRKIGCGDSLIAVERSIEKTPAPLTAAIRELLSTPEHSNGVPRLDNFWKGRRLKLESVTLRNGTATIRISGELAVAGICDEPRIESQIDATAKQFTTVKRVRVFVNNRTLRNAIR
jgi:Sporulation and spore germination